MQDKMVLDFLCLDRTTNYQVTGGLWPFLSLCEMKSTDQAISQDPSCFEILKVQMECRPGAHVLPTSLYSESKRCHTSVHYSCPNGTIDQGFR